MSDDNTKMIGETLRNIKTYEEAWRHSIRSTITLPETPKMQMAAAAQGLLGLLLVGWVFKQVCQAGQEGGDEAALDRLKQIMNEHQQLAKMVGPLDQTTKVQ